MQTGLLHLHSLLRWVILVLLLVSIYTTYKASNNLNKKWWLFTLIATHVMLLIGLYQVYNQYTNAVGSGFSMADIMKTKALRFYIIEHPLLMIIATVLITLAYRYTKSAKYKGATVLYIVALAIILSAIPWPFRADVGRHLMPGM